MNLSFSIFLLDVFNNLMNFNDIKARREEGGRGNFLIENKKFGGGCGSEDGFFCFTKESKEEGNG